MQIKKLSNALIILLFFSSFSRTENVRLFSTTDYVSGLFYRQNYDTIKSDKQVDVHFFYLHFHLPYHLPEKLLDPKRKGQTVSVWKDPKGDKDFQQNWKNTYSYDSIGRVTHYTYSGCVICSTFPYDYAVRYNPAGKVKEILNTIGGKQKFRFYYNKQGDISRFEKYSGDELETVIKLLK